MLDKSEKIALSTPSHPEGTPKGPKGRPKEAKWAPKSTQGHPKAIPKAPKASQRDKLYINKLPINRLRGPYAILPSLGC